MLKRKWLDRKEIKDKILEQRFNFIQRIDSEFDGYIGLLHLDKVYKTLIADLCGKERELLKNGHTWLQWIEKDKNYSVVAMFNQNNELIEWYIDILLSQGLEKDGIPYYDDLYLDVVAFPDGPVIFMDEDELLDALNQKIITKDDFDLAYKVANELKERFTNNMDKEIKNTLALLDYFNSCNK